MDDLSEKLAELLNDPESMNKVLQMAENLLGGNNESAPQNSGSDDSGGDELKAIMSIMSMLKSSVNDSRTQLLTALKPHLSEPKREKVDTAIKILKILEMLPLIKETGLLNL